MARINLLPWRAEQRERKNKEFLTLVVMVVILAALLAFATWFSFNQDLQNQQAANQLITAENAKLDEALKEIETLEQRREDIISRMKVIQDLQGKRPIPVRVWDDMAKAVPEAMYLTKMERQGDTITLTGAADNPNVVSTLIKNLDASSWLGGSAVRQIQKSPEKNVSANSEEVLYPEDNYVTFVVTTQVKSEKSKDEAGEGEESADASEATPQATELTEAPATETEVTDIMMESGTELQPAEQPQPAQPVEQPQPAEQQQQPEAIEQPQQTGEITQTEMVAEEAVVEPAAEVVAETEQAIDGNGNSDSGGR